MPVLFETRSARFFMFRIDAVLRSNRQAPGPEAVYLSEYRLTQTALGVKIKLVRGASESVT